MLTRQRLGRAGEEFAAEFLAGRGYRVLSRNLRCRRGEIDLVCQRGEEVLLVEVKTRSGNSHGGAAEAVDESKRRALAGCLGEYRRLSGWRGPIRFDLITVSVEIVSDVLT